MIDHKSYEVQTPRPRRPDFDSYYVYHAGNVIGKDMSAKDLTEFTNKLFQTNYHSVRAAVDDLHNTRGYTVEIVAHEEQYKKALREYRKHVAHLHDQWKRAVSQEYGIDLIDDPIGAIVFDLAWEEYHSDGYNEVYEGIDEKIDLIHRILRAIPNSNYANEIMEKNNGN